MNFHGKFEILDEMCLQDMISEEKLHVHCVKVDNVKLVGYGFPDMEDKSLWDGTRDDFMRVTILKKI